MSEINTVENLHSRGIPPSDFIIHIPKSSIFDDESPDELIFIIQKRFLKVMRHGSIKDLAKCYKIIPDFHETKIDGKSLLALCFEEIYITPDGEIIDNMIDNRHVAEFLLQNGEDVNRKNFSHVACKRRNYYFLRFLLKHNANFFDTDCKGVTAIEYACRNRWFDGLFLILSETTIQEHDIKVFKKICKFLTDTNSNHENYINKRFTNGETILHLMVKKRNLIAVELLLSFGADPMIKDNYGISPYKIVLTNGWGSFRLLLEVAKSKSNAVPLRKTHKFKWFC